MMIPIRAKHDLEKPINDTNLGKTQKLGMRRRRRRRKRSCSKQQEEDKIEK